MKKQYATLLAAALFALGIGLAQAFPVSPPPSGPFEDLCGTTVNTDTVVIDSNESFAIYTECVITVDGAKLVLKGNEISIIGGSLEIRGINDGSLTMKENSFSVDEMIELTTYKGDIEIKGTTLENLGTDIFSQLGNIIVKKSRIETSGNSAGVEISNINGKIEVKGSLLEASGEFADVRLFSRESGEIVVKESVLTAGEEIRIGSHSGGVEVKGNLASMGYIYGLIASKLVIVSFDNSPVTVKDNYAYIDGDVEIMGDPCVVKNSINYVTGDPLVCDVP